MTEKKAELIKKVMGVQHLLEAERHLKKGVTLLGGSHLFSTYRDMIIGLSSQLLRKAINDYEQQKDKG